VVARPPLLYTSTLALGLVAQAVRPLPLMPRGSRLLRRLGGAALLGVGLASAGWATRTMGRAGTSVDVDTPTTALVTEGPYRYSRNPIYLALSALYLGVALLANARWPVLLFPALLAVMWRGVIEREERYLARRFGEEYLAYRGRVRRWL
jgi:protein-S-isoprenylcysteine O-methyltransferase Ste14